MFKMLADSNIIIYAAQPQHSTLRRFFAENSPFVSVVSYVEVLGYHKLKEAEKQTLEEFFTASKILAISDQVAAIAVELRQQRKMSLGDSLIAATALTHNLILVTRNTDDFKWVTNLSVQNPFDETIN